MNFKDVKDIVQETNDFEVTLFEDDGIEYYVFSLQGYEVTVEKDWVTSEDDIEDIKNELIDDIGEEYYY